MTLAPNRLGYLFILVAPAGAGKNALMNRVMERVGHLRQLPTATTRAMRDNEQQGREHLFVSVAEFKQMLAEGKLLEHQQVHERYYGVPRKTVEDAMHAGEDLIADIDYLGADFIRSQYPDNVFLIFVQPPSVQTLIERMRLRRDDEEEIYRRLLRVPAELNFATRCDYLIVNDDIDHATETLYGIILAARSHREVIRLQALAGQKRHLFDNLSAAIVIHDDAVAWNDNAPYLPYVPIEPAEQPHLAALRAVRETFALDLSPDSLIHAVPPGSDLVPPVAVDVFDIQGAQQVALLYICQAADRFELPPGWSWRPQDGAQLPQRVLDLLAKIPT